MSGCSRSTRTVIGYAVVGVLAIALNAIAQPPSDPPRPSAPPVAGQQPGQPDARPGTLPSGSSPAEQPTTPAPVAGSGSSGPVTGLVVTGPGSGLPFPNGAPVARFKFQIDPKTPIKELLPIPPRAPAVSGPLMTEDLAKVPEVEFKDRPAKGTQVADLQRDTAHQLAKISHMNAKKTDAFMSALLESRRDLAGLPFAMGESCRSSPERSKEFSIAVNLVRQALGGNQIAFFTTRINNVDVTTLQIQGQQGGPPQPAEPTQAVQPPPAPPATTGSFWPQFNNLCQQQDSAQSRNDRKLKEEVTLARIAALMQMLAPESAELRLGLVKYLTGVPHVEATRALARIAIFTPEEDVREAALEALKVRREKDYTDVLVNGLSYPWAPVAKRSAEAIAQLGRSDLLPELVAVLDLPDARMPAMKDVGGKQVAVVRELVKVNHHRNCMMCHAPGSPENVSGSVITAEVPVPGQPLPLPFQGYSQSSPDLMVRVDVTYLRQDFSARLPVAEAQPWPDQQRFDFFVRTRELSAEEAASYRDKLTPKEEGVVSPYHRAALAALREMTGRDTAPTAEAWRKLLKLPATSATVKTAAGAKVHE